MCIPITGGYSWVLNKIKEEADKRQNLGSRIMLCIIPKFLHKWLSCEKSLLE